MTRELNVRITLTWWEQDPTTEEEFAEIIKDAILTCTSHEDVCVQVETVKPKKRAEYLYATATVKRRDIEAGNKGYWRFFVNYSDESKAEYGLQVKDGLSYGIVQCKFNKHTAPNVGDVVRLRKRISKLSKSWQGWSYPQICEVIERKTVKPESDKK